jgi:rhodanese-related sulfurtransferase
MLVERVARTGHDGHREQVDRIDDDRVVDALCHLAGERPGERLHHVASRLALQCLPAGCLAIEDVIAYVRSLARPVPPTPAVAASPAAPVPVVMNPKGQAPDFPLKLGRYASVADVAKAYGEKRRFVLIDARPTSDYLRMHIPGAISVPYFELRGLDVVPNDGTWVVAYCVCPHQESGRVVDELRARGYANTAVLDEGLFVWNEQGHPIEAAAGQLPIAAPPPQPPPFAPKPLPSPPS